MRAQSLLLATFLWPLGTWCFKPVASRNVCSSLEVMLSVTTVPPGSAPICCRKSNVHFCYGYYCGTSINVSIQMLFQRSAVSTPAYELTPCLLYSQGLADGLGKIHPGRSDCHDICTGCEDVICKRSSGTISASTAISYCSNLCLLPMAIIDGGERQPSISS